MLRRLQLLLVLATALAAAGCGSGGSPTDVDDGTILLDSPPSAVHAGIYTALARDFDHAVGAELTLRRLTRDRANPVRELEAGRVDFALLDINDFAVARERGADLVAFMAIVQRPLAAVIARPDVRRPRSLEGRRVGVAGGDTDAAILDAIVRGDGGSPGALARTRVRQAEAVEAVANGRVDAATGWWSAEGVDLRASLPGAEVFRADAFGAPHFPQLVVAAQRQTLDEEPDLAGDVVATLRRGYDQVLADPEVAVETMVTRVRGLDRARTLDQLRAVSPAFTAGVPRYGLLHLEHLLAWSVWIARAGIVEEPPDIEQAFAPRLASAAE